MIKARLAKARKRLPELNTVPVDYHCGMQDGFTLAEKVILSYRSEWKWNEDKQRYECENCGEAALNNPCGISTGSDFCPHCGADMRGVK